MYQHDLDPIAFNLFDISIAWYWLFYPLGFFIVYYLSCNYLNKTEKDFDKKKFIDFAVIIWLSVVLGGRLGYFLFYQPYLLFHEPTSVLQIWRGGMSFHGALLFCILASFALKKYKQFPIYKYGRAILIFLPFALFLGRIGNFINGELWGTPSNLPWAMIFPKADFIPRHPSQLYEAILEGPILFLCIWKTKDKISPIISFILFYGLFRFITEFTREADRHLGYFAGLSLGQYFCLSMILGALCYLFFQKRCARHL